MLKKTKMMMINMSQKREDMVENMVKVKNMVENIMVKVRNMVENMVRENTMVNMENTVMVESSGRIEKSTVRKVKVMTVMVNNIMVITIHANLEFNKMEDLSSVEVILTATTPTISAQNICSAKNLLVFADLKIIMVITVTAVTTVITATMVITVITDTTAITVDMLDALKESFSSPSYSCLAAAFARYAKKFMVVKAAANAEEDKLTVTSNQCKTVTTSDSTRPKTLNKLMLLNLNHNSNQESSSLSQFRCHNNLNRVVDNLPLWFQMSSLPVTTKSMCDHILKSLYCF